MFDLSRLFGGVRSSRGVASVGVMCLVGGLSAVGLVGTGLSGSVLDSLSGSAWLSSSERGDVVLANGANGAGVARLGVPGAKGSKMSVVQRGGFACVRSERADGSATVNCVDDATFGGAGSKNVKRGQQVVRTGSHAYMVEEAKGLVRPLDPKTLRADGDVLEFKAPISTVADDDGRLLVLELETSLASVVVGSSAGEPVTIGEAKGNVFGVLVDGEFAVVAQADSRVTLFADGKVDRRVGLPGRLGSLLVPAEVDGGELPLLSRSDSGVEVVVLDTRTDKGRRVRVKKALPRASEVFATSAGLFVPDVGSGSVVRIDTRSGETETIDMGVGRGEGNLEVFTKDGKLWVNNPNGSKAVVIDGRGERHEINKYDKNIDEVDPGWKPEKSIPPAADTEAEDPPDVPSSGAPPNAPDATTPGSPDSSPTQDTGGSIPNNGKTGPQVGPPGQSTTVPSSPGGSTSKGPSAKGPSAKGPSTKGPSTPRQTTTTTPAGSATPPAPKPAPPRLSPLEGTAGSRSATLTWSVVGQVDSYALKCSPRCKAPTVDRGALSSVVDGLTNGTTYRFTLVATNKDGDSAPAQVEAKPLGDVPDQVSGVTAKAIRGTEPGVAGPVQVAWDPESGSGLEISKYLVTAREQETEMSQFEVAGDATSREITAEDLGASMDDDAEGDWSFTVQAVTTKAGSDLSGEASDPSAEVDLFTVPQAPSPTAVGLDGAVKLTWVKPASSGRPVTYTANGGEIAPAEDSGGMSVQFDGLRNGDQQTYRVAATSGGASAEAASVSALPHGAPQITGFSVTSPTYNRLQASYTIDLHGTGGVSNPPNYCQLSGFSCDVRGGSTGQISKGAGNYTVTLTVVNSFGQRTQASRTVRVNSPPKPIGEACYGGICSQYINKFSGSGKNSFSPNGTIPKGTRSQIDCQASGYGGRNFFHLGGDVWVIAREFAVVNGVGVRNC